MGRGETNRMSDSAQRMSTPTDLAASPRIRIAAVTDLDDCERCVAIQLAVWGYSDGDVIPKRVFIVARAIGGQVIGAWAGRELVGFAMALPGYRDGRAYLHSHMLAVLPEYRNAGLGRRLKLAQRDDALARGIEHMEWTFDPLEIKNAHLNIARLGAIARRYLPDFYGQSSSSLQAGLPSDRLVAEWWLNSDRVRRILEEEPAAQPHTDSQPSDRVHERIEVPRAVSEWKQNPQQRKLAEQLQSSNRIALQAAFAQGLAVIGYERTAAGDGCFLLGPATGMPPE
jgi:predicted GNAT superfamily acetyltransferase